VDLRRSAAPAVLRGTQQTYLCEGLGLTFLKSEDGVDRDNVETNPDWEWWPKGVECRMSPKAIVPYLREGLMRPGVKELLAHLRSLGATIVVYTHSVL